MRAPARGMPVFHPMATGVAPVIGEDIDLWMRNCGFARKIWIACWS
jgi:hypothetical protein